MTGSKKVAWLVVVGSVLLMIWLKKGNNNPTELKQWLQTRKLGEFEKPLLNAGQYHSSVICTISH